MKNWRPLITGSLAYDFIMAHPGRFGEQIRPGRRRAISVAFTAPQMRRAFGGCAGNIAYSLSLLGANPILMATVGDDFSPYRARLKKLGIDDSHVRTISGSFTAQAFIITDQDGGQITLFHPGAMEFAHRQKPADAEKSALAIVAPNGREGMLAHARALADAKTPFIFDPGQGLSLFSADELITLMTLADFAIFNRHEWELMRARVGKTERILSKMVRALIITDGARGSRIRAEEESAIAPAVMLGETADPTGCGDAYRAGLIYAMMRKWNWQTAARFASVIAGFKALSHGGQGHRFSRLQLRKTYRQIFKEELPRR